MRTLPAIREAGAVRSALVLSLALTLLAGCGPELPLSTPEWSADGSRIAFVHYSSEGAGTLFVAEPGGDRPPRRISEDAERCAFSGAKLYFLRRPPEGRKAGAPRSGLCSAALDEEGEPRVDLVLGSGDVRAFTRLQAGPGGLLYIECREKDGKRTFFEFDPAAGKQRQITPEGAEWRAARLSPRGTELAALVPGKDKGLDLVVAQLAGGEPAVVGRLESAQADGAGLAWSPAGDRLAVWYTEESDDDDPAPAGLVLFEPARGEKGRRRLELPRADSPVLVAGFSPDGRKLFFTVLASEKTAEGERTATESHEIDLPAGKPRLLASAPGKLVGARGWSADGRRHAEFTPTGLAVFEAGRAEPVRLWPLDCAECLMAARAALAGGRHEAAAELVTTWLENAAPADDRAALLRLKAAALEAGGKAGESANAYLESLLRYPVSTGRETAAQTAKRLAGYSDAAPDNRLLFAVAEAWKARADGKPEAAAAGLKDAAAIANDRAWSAGLNFAAAETLLDAGGALAAGGLFRKASEVADFPQNDWAGALAAAAYSLAGRDDLAAEEVGRCRDLFPKSLLSADFGAMAKTVAAPAGRLRTAEEAKSADGAASARLEARPLTGVHLSFAPSKTPAGETARVAVLRHEQWRLLLSPAAGGDRVLLDKVPVALARLTFSPDGQKLAFLAGEGERRSLYAIDLAGRPLLGDLKALSAGETDANTRAAGFRWPEGAALPAAVKEP